MVLRLRTPHAKFLKYRAEADDMEISRILRRLINVCIMREQANAAGQAESFELYRRHFLLTPAQLGFLDRMSERLGITRSEAARRVLDTALEEAQLADAELRSVA